jgi:hypothetical protein
MSMPSAPLSHPSVSFPAPPPAAACAAAAPSLLGTRAALLYSAYTSSITHQLDRASEQPDSAQAEAQVASKRTFSQVQGGGGGGGGGRLSDGGEAAPAPPSATASALQLVLLSLNRILWEDVVLVSGELAAQVAEVVQAHYKHVPLLFGPSLLLPGPASAPPDKLCAHPHFPLAGDSARLRLLIGAASAHHWSLLWANILIAFTFVAKDRHRPSVKMIHKTAALFLEPDLARRHELLGQVLGFLARSLPRLCVEEVRPDDRKRAALQAGEAGLCVPSSSYDARAALAFIKCHLIDMRGGESTVDLVCKHHKIPDLFLAQDEAGVAACVFPFHFQHASALLELLLKYRWFRLLGESAAHLLSWRSATALLGGLEADTAALANADVSRHPADVALLALACRSVKWWQCCSHVAVVGDQQEQGRSEGQDDVSEDVISLVKDIWKYTQSCLKEFLKALDHLSEGQILAQFPCICDLLLQLRVWAVVEKCCCWPVGKKLAGDFPWQVGRAIDEACVSLVSSRLPLHFACVTSRLSKLWLVGLLDASVSLQVAEEEEGQQQQSAQHPLYRPTSPLLLTAETLLRQVNLELLEIHKEDDDNDDDDVSSDKAAQYKTLELQLWVLVSIWLDFCQH